MSYEFLAPSAARPHDGTEPVARSPLEPLLIDAGARLEVRDGWSVAADFGSPAAELDACQTRVALADRSQLGKVEIQAPADTMVELVLDATGGARLEPGLALRRREAWWCPLTPERVVVLTDPGATRALRERIEELAGSADSVAVVEVTTAYAAIAVVGPGARELLARLSALDLRPAVTPEGGFRPGSVARVPAMVLREAGERFLLLFGAAQAHYMWTVTADAGEPLDAALVGTGALEQLVPVEEPADRA